MTNTVNSENYHLIDMLNLLINLDRSVNRFKSMTDQLSRLGVNFSRISAVDGNKLTNDQISRITYPLSHFESKFRFTRELTKGEIGCFLSHRNCWLKLIESDFEFALIMEDDIKISRNAVHYLNSSDWIPPGVDICQLSCLQEFVKGKIRHISIEIDSYLKLVAPLYPQPLGTQCYIISKQAAKEALKFSEVLPAPVDNFLFTLWFDLANKFTIWRTSPTLVIPQKTFESDIGNRKKQIKKAPFFIRHGLTRFLTDKKIKKIQKDGLPFVFEFKE